MSQSKSILLYQALLIFRNSILPFLIEQLSLCYPEKWETEEVRKILGSTALEKRYERRYGTKIEEGVTPIAKIYEFLDIGDFPRIVQNNWDSCFAGIFEQRETIETLLREIVNVRNNVAHQMADSLSVDDTWRALDKIERLTRFVDTSAAEEIAQLKKELQLEVPQVEEIIEPESTSVELVYSDQLRIQVPIPGLLTDDEFFGSVEPIVGAFTFVHSIFVIFASGNPGIIQSFLQFLKTSEDLTSIATSLPNRYLANLEAAPLRIVSAYYGSPASFDLLGVGKVLEVLRDTIKDIMWRGKHELKMSELEYQNKQSEIEQKNLNTEKTAIEIEAEKARIEQLKLENERMLVEIASKKLDLIQKASGLDLSDEEKSLIVASLIPKLLLIASDPSIQLLESSQANLLAEGNTSDISSAT